MNKTPLFELSPGRPIDDEELIPADIQAKKESEQERPQIFEPNQDDLNTFPVEVTDDDESSHATSSTNDEDSIISITMIYHKQGARGPVIQTYQATKKKMTKVPTNYFQI